MKVENRKTVYDNLNNYCYMAEENDFIEVTDWTNGEGYDIHICNKGENKYISLTHGEIDAINYLKQTLSITKV